MRNNILSAKLDENDYQAFKIRSLGPAEWRDG